MQGIRLILGQKKKEMVCVKARRPGANHLWGFYIPEEKDELTPYVISCYFFRVSVIEDRISFQASE